MAVEVQTKPHVTFNSVDISEWVEGVEWTHSAEDANSLASGDVARHRHEGGAQDGELRLSLLMDYAAGATYATIAPQVGKVIDVKVRRSTDAIGTTNPERRGKVLVTEFAFVTGRVGEVSRQDVTWPNADLPTDHTS